MSKNLPIFAPFLVVCLVIQPVSAAINSIVIGDTASAWGVRPGHTCFYNTQALVARRLAYEHEPKMQSVPFQSLETSLPHRNQEMSSPGWNRRDIFKLALGAGAASLAIPTVRAQRPLLTQRAAAYQTDEQLNNLRQWVQVGLSASRGSSGTALAVERAVSEGMRLSETDPEWAQLQPYMLNVFERIQASQRVPESERRALAAALLAELMQINETLFVPRGWLLIPEDVPNGFVLARLDHSEVEQATFKGERGEPQTKDIPVHYGWRIDLGAGLGTYKDAAAYTIGPLDHAVVFVDIAGTENEFINSLALIDSESAYYKQALRSPLSDIVPFLKQGVLRDGWAVIDKQGHIRVRPEFKQALAVSRLNHEISHALKKPPSGFITGDNDEAFAYLTQLQGDMRYTQLATLMLGARFEAINRIRTRYVTLAMTTLARAAGQDAYAERTARLDTSVYTELDAYLMGLPVERFDAAVKAARIELNKTLSGPLDWTSSLRPPAPLPLSERSAWQENMSAAMPWRQISMGIAGAGVVVAILIWLRGRTGSGGGGLMGGSSGASRQVKRAAIRESAKRSKGKPASRRSNITLQAA